MTCLLVTLLVVLAGCADQRTRPGGGDDSIARQMVEPTMQTPLDADQGPIDLASEQDAPTPLIEPTVEPGTGQFINEGVARAPVGTDEAPQGKITFNFENQPIQAVVKAILGDLLEKNYIIAPGVQGNVSYATSQPVRVQDAMPILETLLGWTGNTLIFTEGRYTVLPIQQAIPGHLTPRLAPAQQAKGYEVRIFPLHYISPAEMQKLLKPFAPEDAFISVDTSRSMLVLAGTPTQLINYQRTINTFDVDWLKGMSVGVYNVQNQEVARLLPQLEDVFGASGESPLAGMFRFVPVEATNSIIVITPQPEYLERAQEWLARLDAGLEGGDAGQQLYIYNVINMEAFDLADYLNQIFNGTAPSSRARDIGGALAPGLTPVEAGGRRGLQGMTENNQQQNQSRREQRRSSAASMPADGDGPRITAIDQNNQLLVLATASQWNTIKLAAKRLDIQPLQVQIEARILEVKLTGSFSFGVQWYLENLVGGPPDNGGGGDDGGGDDGGGDDGGDGMAGVLGRGIAMASGGGSGGGVQRGWKLGDAGLSPDGDSFFYSFLNSRLQVALHAMESSGNTKVLSAPSVVVTNNQPASIQVGDDIPVSQNYITGIGGIGGIGNTGGYSTGMVNYRQTGIKLDVTPRVNPGGLVYMDIDQEVSSPGARSGPSGNVQISTRNLTTQIAVQSGQTVLLGGLIQQNDIESKSGVPFLHRIPVLGRLFGSTSRDRNRTELLILITPRVIRDSQEAARVTHEYQERFESLKPLRLKLESERADPDRTELIPLDEPGELP